MAANPFAEFDDSRDETNEFAQAPQQQVMQYLDGIKTGFIEGLESTLTENGLGNTIDAVATIAKDVGSIAKGMGSFLFAPEAGSD